MGLDSVVLFGADASVSLGLRMRPLEGNDQFTMISMYFYICFVNSLAAVHLCRACFDAAFAYIHQKACVRVAAGAAADSSVHIYVGGGCSVADLAHNNSNS